MLPPGVQLPVLRHIPRLLQHIFIDIGIAVESLERAADSAEIVAAFAEGILHTFVNRLEIAHQHGVAAEVAQVAPDVGHAEELLGALPHLLPFAVVVEHQLALRREGGQVGLHAVVQPVLALVVEEPAHLQPGGLRISLFKRFIDLAAHAAQILGFPGGRHQFVEDVDSVDMVGAVDFGLQGDELLLDLGVEVAHRIEETAGILILIAGPGLQLRDGGIRADAFQFARHVTGEGGQHRSHREFPLARDNLLLEFQLAFQPRFGKRTAPAVDILHAVPRQVRRTGEVGAHLFGRKAHLRPNLVPDRLLSGDGQRQVHAVERHPVDHVLPLLPVPPGHRVAVGAVVEEEAVRHACLDPDRIFHRRKTARHPERVPDKPANLAVTVIFQVIVETHRHCPGVVAANHNPASILPERKIIRLSGGKRFKREAVRLGGKHAGGQRRSGCHLRIDID